MLQSIRDRSQGWLAGTIISIVIATFALWGIHSYINSSGGQPDVAATVNGQKITAAALNAAYERLRQQQQNQLGADFVIDQKTQLQLKKQALNQLIMAQVLSDAAIKEGYRITMGEVEGALLAIPAFQVNGRFSRERFNEVLNSTLYNEKAFLADLQASMLINQVRGGFIASAFVLPNEVSTAIKLINQKRDIGYLVIPITRFIKTIDIDEKTASAYYAQHPELFTTPEQVSIDYLELSIPQLASSLHFSDEQLQQFYKNNLSAYTAPQRWRIAHILLKAPKDATSAQLAQLETKLTTIEQRLKAGESFAKMAQQYSDDKLTAKGGGVLPWFNSGMIDPVIEQAAAKLERIGAVSAPVQSKYGFSIIKLIDVQKPQIKAFSEVRAQVAKALAEQRAQQLFSDDSDKLSNLTYANPGSLDVAAKTLNLQVKSSAIFDKAGGKDSVTANPKVIAAAFRQDVLQGTNSDVIELSPDTVVVLRVKQHIAVALKPFSAVRGEVIEILQKQAAQKKAQDLSQKLLQELIAGKSAQGLAAQNDFSWQVLNNTGRYNSKAPAAIVNYAFQMPQAKDAKTLSSGSFQLPNGDVALVQLLGIHEGDSSEANAAQRRIYREELENTSGLLDYTIYVKEQLGKAKIEITNKDLAATPDSSI